MDPSSPQGFAPTRWTRVLAARGDSEAARAALSELCSAYYAPVVAFLTQTGCGYDEPREVAHEFFASLLARNGFASVNPERGRFRSYLLGALKHFVANRNLRGSRAKRGGATPHQPLDPGTDTTFEPQLAAASEPVDSVFDRAWAVSIVEGALAELEREAVDAGTHAQFAVLKSWLSLDGAPGSQAEAAVLLGLNEGAVKVAIHRLRRRFRELVRAEVAQTIPEGDDIDLEVRYLVQSLAQRV